MTWIKFMIWLCAIYGTYYAVVILLDLRKKQSSADNINKHELSFDENIVPVSATVERKPDSAIISSGGKTLKEIFSLAREEMIEYTRAVSY